MAGEEGISPRLAPVVAGADDENATPWDMPNNPEDERQKMMEALSAIVGRLSKEAEKRVSERNTIEKRWLEDLLQYHGQYDELTLKDLKAANKSQLFLNITRSKTNTCEARLWDMLFPTDDKNWGIRPTPVPTLSQTTKLAISRAEQLAGAATAAKAAGDVAAEQGAIAEAAQLGDAIKQAEKEMLEAAKRAEAMEAEMADQLVECDYASECRKQIRDACLYGTGVKEGPITSDEYRRSWSRKMDESGQMGAYTQEPVKDNTPRFRHVDLWGFFPDMEARTVEDCSSFFERHLMTAKQLRNLARCEGFEKDAIRKILRAKPRGSAPTYISELRNITGVSNTLNTETYTVWKYRGPLSAEDMSFLCECMGKDFGTNYSEVDPLDEIPVIIWFCQDEIIKFGIHQLDSGAPIYSVFTLERDESSIFGLGVPQLMKDSQKALGAAWRMMMDNAGLSSGPQIEIDPSVIEPADGKWTLLPRKVWKRIETAPANKNGIITHNIESHQNELQAIIEMARDFINEETSIPLMAQGDQGNQPIQTAQGMSLLMNAANIIVRRIVKNYDDQVTDHEITNLYDWNMQFSKKEHIKGDFTIDARGSSVLLLREVKSQNLMGLATNFAAHPIFGPMIKPAPLLRAIAKANMIGANDFVKTDDEMQREAEAAAQNPQDPPEIATAKFERETEMELAKLEHQNKMEELGKEHEIVMSRVAHQSTVDLQKKQMDVEQLKEDRVSKERQQAVEVATPQDKRIAIS